MCQKLEIQLNTYKVSNTYKSSSIEYVNELNILAWTKTFFLLERFLAGYMVAHSTHFTPPHSYLSQISPSSRTCHHVVCYICYSSNSSLHDVHKIKLKPLPVNVQGKKTGENFRRLSLRFQYSSQNS